MVRAAPLCNACGRVFMAFGTRLSLSHSAEDLIGLSQSGCFFFSSAAAKQVQKLSVMLNQMLLKLILL